jgi:hypothetical protein
VELTLRRLNRATLARQSLLRRRRTADVVDAVRGAVALQAQEAASPYIALWNRVADLEASDLDAAFADRRVVKATLMRITLHAVAADDHRSFHAAMLGTLRDSRLNDRRFAATGLSTADADDLVPELLEFVAEPRSKDEIEDLLARCLGGPPEPGVWWALRSFAPLVHAVTGGPWSFGRSPSFVAASMPPGIDGTRPAAVWLVRRYLEGFGPATARDIAQFALLRQSSVRPALAAMAETLVTHVGPRGEELFDLPGGELPGEDTPAPPRLMAMWDSTLLAYADRCRVVPEEHRPHVIRRNGDVLPTVLVDGYVHGVWRAIEEGIEVLAFTPIRDGVWDELASEAQGLLALLDGRDPKVYGRYHHWWSKLPEGEVRLLGR